MAWIGTATSPLCLLYANFLQLKTLYTKLCHFVEQVSILCRHNVLGSTITYPSPANNFEYELTMLAFVNASKHYYTNLVVHQSTTRSEY